MLTEFMRVCFALSLPHATVEGVILIFLLFSKMDTLLSMGFIFIRSIPRKGREVQAGKVFTFKKLQKPKMNFLKKKV